MRRIMRVATAVGVMLVVTIESGRALDGHGRLVVVGASPQEVKERCGEPTVIEDVMKHLPQRAYDPLSQTTVVFVTFGEPAFSMVGVGTSTLVPF
jgi:hypothetical protein